MSVTHIAGPAITACGRLVQRCSLCGEKMVDSKNTMVPCNPNGSAPDPIPTWPVGRLVNFSGGNPDHQSLLDDTDKLPEDSCINLIE